MRAVQEKTLAAFPAAFTLAAVLVQLHVGAYATDRGQTGDEAAHFVTSLMLTDYLHHLGNPVSFAKAYYVHLPRVAIGHWPPFFEMLQAAVFAIFGGSNAVAMALQAVILGLMSGLPAALMARHFGLAAGLLTGLVIFCNRFALFLVDTVMADNLLGLLVFLSAWGWSWYYRRPSPLAAMLTAAAFIAAILTKGTALCLLLLPPLYAWLAGDWRFLLRRWSLIALALVLVLTVPWYVFTYKMAATGWNYSWGSFTVAALPFFAKALFGDFGLPCLIAFILGAWRAIARRHTAPPDMMAFALMAILQFFFLLLVPADLQPRYLVPVYPCAAMVAVWELSLLAEKYLPGRIAAQSGLAVAVLLSIVQGFRAPHVESFRTAEAFAQIGTSPNPLILVSGGSRFEGAMISTVAAADRGRHFYALRASKLLSSSSFMGNGYQEKFTRPEDMKAWLLDNQIGWVTVDTSDESMQYGHNKMLLTVLAADPAAFRPVWRGTREDGTIALFQTAASAAPPDHPQKMLADQAPSGVP